MGVRGIGVAVTLITCGAVVTLITLAVGNGVAVTRITCGVDVGVAVAGAGVSVRAAVGGIGVSVGMLVEVVDFNLTATVWLESICI